MTTTQRLEWLDALALGDLVVVSGREEFAATVLRRTPSGRIIVGSPRSEFVFNSNGIQRGGDQYWTLHLEPMTDAWREAAEHRALAERLSATQWRAASLSTLRRVAAVLDDAGE